jgi:omega-amidase
MKISIMQSNIFWEDKMVNINNYNEDLSKIKNTDLVVFPEMFTTGFSMNPELHAETMDGETIDWMKSWSVKLNAAICGSLIIKDVYPTFSRYYNRFVFVKPSGEIEYYDKVHLFTYGRENNHYNSGHKKIIINWKGFNILPLVCYDLRFPVFSRWTSDKNYNLIINVANWPESRSLAWKTLLRSRAIENQSYVIGCNRIGKDGNGTNHSGNSAVINPFGDALIESSVDSILEVEISPEVVSKARIDFPFLEDRDQFKLGLNLIS